MSEQRARLDKALQTNECITLTSHIQESQVLISYILASPIQNLTFLLYNSQPLGQIYNSIVYTNN